MNKKKLVSVITPCFNEEESVNDCYLEVKNIFDNLEGYDYEHIFSDNSSTDSTIDILSKICIKDKNIKVLINSHNVGPFLNNFNALQYATGDYVLIFLPVDLQDPPHLIPDMIDLINSGSEIVLGIRDTRIENVFLKLFRTIFYKLMNIFSEHKVPVGAGEFMMITKKVHKIITNSDHISPYIRGIVAQVNYPKSELRYTWNKRKFGKSKNSFKDLIDQAINAFLMMAYKPVRYILYLGGLSLFCSSIIFVLKFLEIIQIVNLKFLEYDFYIYLGFLFFSIILFSLGLIGEYVVNINNKVNNDLKLQIVKRINFD